MKIKIKSQQDWWAGWMFISVGLFFMVVALGTPAWFDSLVGTKLIPGYQMGSAVRMGPAYFPVVLGGILAALGLLVLLDSIVEEGPPVAKFHFRPLLFILASSLAFAYLLKPLGMVLATALYLVATVRFVGRHAWWVAAAVGIGAAAFNYLVFAHWLRVPFPQGLLWIS